MNSVKCTGHVHYIDSLGDSCWYPISGYNNPISAKRRQNDWKIRLTEESKNWKYMYFLTFTYGDDCKEKVSSYPETLCYMHLSVPDRRHQFGEILNVINCEDVQMSNKEAARYQVFPCMNLNRKHISDFLDNVRNSCKNPKTLDYFPDFKMKYTLVGEYGNRKYRPHYHLLAFSNSPYLADVCIKKWRYGRVDNTQDVASGETPYISTDYSGQIANYISKYIAKPNCLVHPLLNNQDYDYDIVAPFLFCSRGIGDSWLQTSAASSIKVTFENQIKSMVSRYCQNDNTFMSVSNFIRDFNKQNISLVDFERSVKSAQNILRIASDGFSYRLPRYYLKKLFYHPVNKDEENINELINYYLTNGNGSFSRCKQAGCTLIDYVHRESPKDFFGETIKVYAYRPSSLFAIYLHSLSALYILKSRQDCEQAKHYFFDLLADTFSPSSDCPEDAEKLLFEQTQAAYLEAENWVSAQNVRISEESSSRVLEKMFDTYNRVSASMGTNFELF